jgi:uncharacterized protein (TIGR03435 family)
MKISWSLTGLAAITLTLTGLIAQTTAAPAFEVASVKPDNVGGNYVDATPDTVRVHSARLETCIKWAYGLQSGQLSGAGSAISNLLTSDRYTITGKAGVPSPEGQLRIMLQTLLADRFKLVAHRESREMPVYALKLEKNGPKFHESVGDGDTNVQATSKLNRRWTGTKMTQFVDTLAEAMQAPVVDQTGLTGRYDFSLDLTPYLPPDGQRPDIGVMMLTALREQLGLKLESRRSTVDVLIVDHIEKPTAN